MASHDFPKALLQRPNIKMSFETDSGGKIVNGIPGLNLVKEP
jgi:hypothetical protein